MTIEIEEIEPQKRTSGWQEVDEAFDQPDECMYARDWAQHGGGNGSRWADDDNGWGEPEQGQQEDEPLGEGFHNVSLDLLR